MRGANALIVAFGLAQRPEVILCIYGDTMRVPASGRNSLLKAKAAGADIRMVYSTLDALQIARENREREVVFFAIGSETTTPPTALSIRQAAEELRKVYEWRGLGEVPYSPYNALPLPSTATWSPRCSSRAAIPDGAFQDRTLAVMIADRLSAADLRLFEHVNVPSNDGGVNLGQADVAAVQWIKTSG